MEAGNKFYQQGDVLIEKIDESTLGEVKKIAPRNLADGETTGHAHRVIDGKFQMFEGTSWKNSGLFMKAETPCTIGHEEHGPIVIDAGVYRIGIVQEYDPFLEAARQVRD